MDRRQFLIGTAAVITPAIAGCGGGDGNGGMTTEPTMTTTEEPAMTTTEQSLPSSVTVEMKDTTFNPETVSVAVGGTVEWTNKDGYGHDVTSAQFSDGAASWDYSKSLSNGGTASFTFDSAGFYEYYCTIHGKGSMCGVVVVGDTDHTGNLPCGSGDYGGSY